jgi:predicted Zn-dependent peptidase
MTETTTPPSFVHFTLPGDFHLAVNSNKKMKTVLVTANVLGNLDESVTRMAILPAILRRGTRKHRDMQSMNRYLESLYGASLSSAVQKVGEWHLLRFRLEAVNERFLPGETGVLREALEFLIEFLQDPLEVDGGFHPEYLEQEKAQLERTIEALIDDKAAYAERRLIEEMCRGEPFHFCEQGRIADIPSIDARSLRDFHRSWARRYPLHLYVAGDIDVESTKDLVMSVFSTVSEKREGGYRIGDLPAPVSVKDVREKEERMDVNQARLVLGFRHGITYADNSYEALLLMNGILGGFSHSKLFRNVREKANLAYSVHSSAERTKGLLFISAGVAPERRNQALAIILEQVEALRKGEISEEEMHATRLTILHANEMLEDNLGALADVDFVWGLHGRKLDFSVFRERLQKVKRAEIVEMARRLAHDTTYFLTK